MLLWRPWEAQTLGHWWKVGIIWGVGTPPPPHPSQGKLCLSRMFLLWTLSGKKLLSCGCRGRTWSSWTCCWQCHSSAIWQVAPPSRLCRTLSGSRSRIPGPTAILGRRRRFLETDKRLDLLCCETVRILSVLAEGCHPFLDGERRVVIADISVSSCCPPPPPGGARWIYGVCLFVGWLLNVPATG